MTPNTELIFLVRSVEADGVEIRCETFPASIDWASTDEARREREQLIQSLADSLQAPNVERVSFHGIRDLTPIVPLVRFA